MPEQSRIARFTERMMCHRRAVLSTWGIGCLVLAVVAIFMGARIFSFVWVPGFDSSTDAARWSLNEQTGDNAFIIVQAPDGVTASEILPRVAMLSNSAAQIPDVIGVVSPFDNPGQISEDGTIAYSVVQFDVSAADIDPTNIDRLLDLAEAVSGEDLNASISGSVIEAFDVQTPDNAALAGFALTLVILLVAFGSVMASVVPLMASLAALAAGFLVVAIATPVIDVTQLVPAFSLMIGIGVSIDYALYIVDRVRQNQAAGMENDEAIVSALDSSGRAVIFAGVLALIPLAGLFIVGAPFIASLGVAGIIVILFSVLASLTFLPAVLSYCAGSLDRWKIPKLYKPAGSGTDSTPYKIAVRALDHPVRYVLLIVSVLVIAMLPLFNINLGFSHGGDNPISVHSSDPQSVLDQGFGEGFTGPLIVTIEGESPIDSGQIESLRNAIEADEGVAVTSPVVFGRDPASAVFTALPADEPQSDEIRRTLQRLRNDVVPETMGELADGVVVGGPPAELMDVTTTLSNRMLLYILVSVLGTVLLLAAVFRSIVVPVKAVIVSALSSGAALGIMVGIVQWGFVGRWVGAIDTGPIEPYVPVMLFALLFGISINYEVFLLSRVREDYVEHGDNDRALEAGLASSARFLAAAAAIMTRVFSTFLVMGDSRATQQLGLGLGIAVFIDVMLIRFVLAPATMKLLSKWNWWCPDWLERYLPDFHIEPSAHSTDAAQAAAD
ncbi:MMPL family transporter [soil metagenome]